MFAPGSIVVVHLGTPSEKYWGVLEEVGALGLVVRALSLASFDDWLAEVGGGEEPSIGFTTMFVPMARVERVFLDQPAGEVLSFSQRFERRIGRSARVYLNATPG